MGTETVYVNNKVYRIHDEYIAVLKWCNKHHEPVWWYSDDSFTCQYDLITESSFNEHIVVDGPWTK